MAFCNIAAFSIFRTFFSDNLNVLILAAKFASPGICSVLMFVAKG